MKIGGEGMSLMAYANLLSGLLLDIHLKESFT